MRVRLAAVAVAAGLAVFTAACSSTTSGSAQAADSSSTSAEPSSSESPEPSTSEPTTAPTTPGSTATGKATVPQGVPAGFPIPPGVQIQGGGYQGTVALQLTGVPAKQVADFYRAELPKAGYKITADDSVSAGGQDIIHLEFTGNGYKVDVASLGGAAVSILMEKG